MSQFPTINTFVGEDFPTRYSFLSGLLDFQPPLNNPAQTLVGASIAWVSQSPLLASFDVGSSALVTSEEGSAAGITNDAVIGRFTMLAAGICTVYVTVSAVNPTETYVGIVQFLIEAIPTP